MSDPTKISEPFTAMGQAYEAGTPLDSAPWHPRHVDPLSPTDLMRIRALVNTQIAPAQLIDVARLESRRSLVFLGRWGTFRFDVVVDLAELQRSGSIDQFARKLVLWCNDAVAQAIESIVDEKFSGRASALDDRLRDAEQLGLNSAELVRDLEYRMLELEALVRTLVDRALTPWYRRAWRAVVAWAAGFRRA